MTTERTHGRLEERAGHDTLGSPANPAPPTPPARDTGQTRWRLTAMVLAVGLAISGMGTGWLLWGRTPAETPVTVASEQQPGVVSSVPAGTEPVAGVATALLPTVVQIQSSGGLGSGVVYDPTGLILTAAHVVGDDRQVSVRLADGDQLTGTVVGADPASDVAVIRVDRAGLAAAPLAIGQELQVGQTAVALGSPYGLDQTVTSGVVSAANRSIAGSDGVVREVVQTDASINPGNSGGPLADLEGRVIGINDAIFSRSGGNEGVGFAIPITVVKDVADHLVTGTPVETGFLGITGTEPQSGTAGALVTSVVTGSPADRAGIRVGDLITAVDDTRVESMVDLAGRVRAHQPGARVVIHLERAGDRLDLQVTLGTANQG